MDEEWKQARLDELWDAYIHAMPDFGDFGIVSDRTVRAVEVLAALKVGHDRALAEGNNDSAAVAAQRGRVVWQLLALEIGGWLLSFPIFENSISNEELWVGQDRAALALALELHDRSAPDAHRSAIDPECVLMPKWLLQRLSDALSALDQGEVQELVRPRKMGRHDDAWSWDKMRTCAVEHVAFLRGQGSNAKIARRRVASATGIPEKTLLDWEGDKKFRAECKTAFDAGHMKIVFADIPDYKGVTDTAVLARLKRFETEPSLGEFGRHYRERYGRRHNRDPGSGK